ncbi:hypothetical protein [Aliarcobacter lanthieri]|uniref:hypothetical protein n=1 Tax=Aliarcobacter lanthieri TaxID=1355374 RepID=UPI003AAD7E05
METNITLELPTRNNQEYLRIEKYEDYEFTHCIAYEMAIRNKEVIILTKLLENLNILNKELFLNQNFFDSNIEEVNSYVMSELIYLEIVFDNFSLLLNQYENDYLLNIIQTYNNTTFQMFKSHYNENKSLKNLFNKATNADKILIIMVLCVSVDWKLEREYYVVNEMKSITKKHIDKLFPKNNNYEPSEEISSHIDTVFTDPNYKENYIHEERAGYIVYQGAYENDNSFTINKVIPNFAQPLRMFNTMSISINPSLPLNDILSFVKKIKEDYDKKCDFKNFFEFSLEDLIVNSDTKSTIDDISSYDKQRWADMFYIYDYFQFYFSEGNKINKGKTENNKENKEDDLTTVAKEISLQLSYYHILKHKKPLCFYDFADIGNYKSSYSKYETDLLFGIKERIEENKEYEKYIKLKKSKDGVKEETINFYMTADYIKTVYYPKMKKFIEGKNPEYLKFIDGRNHTKNSFIDGKNNASSKL